MAADHITPAAPGQILLDGSALSDGRAQAGIGRAVRELSAELTALAPHRVRLVIPRQGPLSESRPGRQLHAERALLPQAWTARPSLVHGLGGEPLLGWPGSRQLVTVHDLELWNDASAPPGRRGSALRLYRRVLGRQLGACAALVTVSPSVRGEIVDRLGIAAERIHVVPHGLGKGFAVAPDAADERRRTEAGAPARYLLWVGSLRRWDPRKGLETLVDALARVQPAPPPLLLAGAPGAGADRVLAAAAAAGVTVEALGAVDDPTLAALYRGSSAVVLPSRHEGFGLPALEAMACGAPLVCSEAGNLGLLGGSIAHLVPPGDAAALAAALAGVIANPEAAQRRAREGAARAAAHTWRRAAEQTLAVYDALLAASR